MKDYLSNFPLLLIISKKYDFNISLIILRVEHLHKNAQSYCTLCRCAASSNSKIISVL